MSWSRAEVSALAAKAARGAGAPAAQAALFGQAAALHLAQGRRAEALTEALDMLPEGPIGSLPLVLQRALPEAAVGNVVDVDWDGDRELAQSYVDTLPVPCVVRTQGVDKLTLGFVGSERPLPLRRISGCDALIAQMTKLARRTFVPESAASRLSGAGAGLSDND
ncbi:hypothetical protein So717_32190 [Roseobacter cerasinus]|uniref:Uncharacterized protein n=1 Tax=Roseobacter cerasinus TaxID=2602289 RepID=A0A640VYZ6_9RHOB|nr:hypothetical protein [Roseobacter cerasinus]GFE51466.1 hypothetical protein So717_32190 [Roseobacter cerasinus]